MELKDICRNIAISRLSKPGTVVECMVGSILHGQLGNVYTVSGTTTSLAGIEHLRLADVPFGGVRANSYRMVVEK